MVKVANKVVEIHAPYGITRLHSCEYLVNEGPVDFVIEISENELDNGVIEWDAEYNKPLSACGIEHILLHRKLCETMLGYDTFLLHGAVIAINNEAYMFTAKSGTGKTTHIIKWLKTVPGAFVVNGDKPLIIAGNQYPQACGTPWCGMERMGSNAIVPLKAIVFMDRAEVNAIRPISFMQALPRLLEQTHRPADPELMRKTVQLLASLNGKVDFYHFDFNNFAPDALAVSYQALTGQPLPENP